ncbi:MAG: hypothetical protein WBW88_07420, partial [Rhodothermales bacterium]
MGQTYLAGRRISDDSIDQLANRPVLVNHSLTEFPHGRRRHQRKEKVFLIVKVLHKMVVPQVGDIRCQVLVRGVPGEFPPQMRGRLQTM